MRLIVIALLLLAGCASTPEMQMPIRYHCGPELSLRDCYEHAICQEKRPADMTVNCISRPPTGPADQ